MKKLEKILVGAAVATSLAIGGIMYNVVDYAITTNRLDCDKADEQLNNMDTSYNPFKIGYQKALKHYVRDCDMGPGMI